MAGKPNISLIQEGMAAFRDLYGRAPNRVEDALLRALTEETQLAFRLSQRKIPVKTGVAKNSGKAHAAKMVGPGRVEGSYTYGGAAKKYVKRLNDDRSLNHPRGGEAGFATDPVITRVPEIRAGILKRVAKALKNK
jgi:hypothetical protein